jgi:hypothetical protein
MGRRSGKPGFADPDRIIRRDSFAADVSVLGQEKIQARKEFENKDSPG